VRSFTVSANASMAGRLAALSPEEMEAALAKLPNHKFKVLRYD